MCALPLPVIFIMFMAGRQCVLIHCEKVVMGMNISLMEAFWIDMLMYAL